VALPGKRQALPIMAIGEGLVFRICTVLAIWHQTQ
jgi:hypothetical protein